MDLCRNAGGAEIGFDLTFVSDCHAPEGRCRPASLSTIFLRLIKTIIAPAHFQHAGSRHCRTFQSETGWTHGHQGALVF